jgi:hypothetical protein
MNDVDLVLGDVLYEANGKITNTQIIDSKGPETESSYVPLGSPLLT